MEFNNPSLIIGVCPKGFERPSSSQHLVVEIVVMDRSNGVLQPLLYQLHSSGLEGHDFSSLKHNSIFSLDNNSFALVGEVLSIDKAKKIIYLSNNISVAYKYLIVASGIKPSVLGSTNEEELAPGIYALIDALKVRNNASQTLLFPEAARLGFESRKKTHAQINPHLSSPLQTIQKFLNPLAESSLKSLDMVISGTEKRLFEVQL